MDRTNRYTVGWSALPQYTFETLPAVVDNWETYSTEVTNAESKILIEAGEQKVGDFLAKRRDIPHSGFYD